jgi:GDP-4-dehydro-6-deoxy-D-mannose reductase
MDVMTMSDRRILITGANGFTGQHACDHFAKLGMEVVAVVRSEGTVQANISTYICDLTNHKDVEQMMKAIKPAYVLHLAGKNSVAESWQQPVLYMESNMLATMYVMQALRDTPECRILVVGSNLCFPISANPEPPNPYSLSKTLQSLIAQSWSYLFKQSTMIANPTNLIGPGRSNGVCGLIARKIINWKAGLDHTPFKLSSLQEERDYIDVRDAVRAFEVILVKGKSGTTYSVYSGVVYSLGDIARTFERIAGESLLFEVVNQSIVSSFKPAYSGNLNILGWKTMYSLEQSLRDSLQFFRESEQKGM